jgi:hypothetical protein
VTAPLLFLDIETAPIAATDPLWSEYLHARAVPPDEAEILRARTPLDPILGRVVCIGVAGLTGPVEVWCEDDEAQTLGALEGMLFVERPCLVGHNVRGFDVPFLTVRARIHKMHRLARSLMRAQTLDTLDAWPMVGHPAHSGKPAVPPVRGINGASLPSVCRALGIPHPGDALTGADVASAWESGDRQAVVDHCRADVERVREVYRTLCP